MVHRQALFKQSRFCLVPGHPGNPAHGGTGPGPFSNAIEYFNTRNHKLYQRSLVLEESIDRLEREITDYIGVSQKNLTSENSHHAL